MTDQHPLTDEIIEEIARFDPDADDMRAAYDLGFEKADKGSIKYVIRAFSEGHDKGSDDQLEKVIEWLKDNLHLMPTGVDYIVGNLREAMRPTTTLEDN